MRKLNVLLADDNKHFLEALKFMLKESNSERIDSIYEAYNGKDVLDILKKKQVDLVFMDVEMPELNGIETTKQATEQYRFLTVIALSFHEEMEFIMKMLEAGARNYIVKEDINSEIINKVFEQNCKN
jgi:YesN/AraC family two-component response regulator